MKVIWFLKIDLTNLYYIYIYLFNNYEFFLKYPIKI